MASRSSTGRLFDIARGERLRKARCLAGHQIRHPVVFARCPRRRRALRVAAVKTAHHAARPGDASEQRERGVQRLGLAGNRSRVEGDKRTVPETHGERQEGQHFVGNDQEESRREFLYAFPPFQRLTVRQGGCDTKSHRMSGSWRVTTAPTSAQVGSSPHRLPAGTMRKLLPNFDPALR
jgi:hypothetical protein